MKSIVSLILLFSVAFANDISYSFHISNKTPYQNEAIFLDVNITQEDDSVVMLFKFNLKKSKVYTFHQIDFKENDKYHHLTHQYKYLVYPKQAGKVALAFEMIKSLTDDDKVAYAISGDRDNVKGLVKQDLTVNLSPLPLSVKKLPNGTTLVGDYSLTYELDKTSTEAYDPVHLAVVLKGKGVAPILELLPKSKSYNLFTQTPKVKSLHTSKGTHNVIKWDYAISGKEDFVLPEVLLKAFNPTTKKSYELIVPSQAIAVNKVPEASLVDKENTPSISSPFDWSWLGWLFSYVAVFIAGFLMPRDLFVKSFFKRKNIEKEESFTDKCMASKNHKELLKLLFSQNTKEYAEVIKSLEEVLYNGKKTSLSSVKKMLR